MLTVIALEKKNMDGLWWMGRNEKEGKWVGGIACHRNLVVFYQFAEAVGEGGGIHSLDKLVTGY